MPDVMKSNVPRVEIDGHSVPVLHNLLVPRFPGYSSEIQRKTIRLLEGLLEELQLDGSPEHLLRLKVVDEEDIPKNPTPQQKALYKHGTVDLVCWQLANLMRYSKPTRIAEAVPHITYVVENKGRLHNNPGCVDVVPQYYLGVALAHTGEDRRAIEVLDNALNTEGAPSPKNVLWARAHLAWLLRKAGRITEAEKQERITREWILMRPFAYPPSELQAAITDDEIPDVGAHIIDHPDMQGYFSGIIQIGPNSAIHIGF